MARKFVQPLRLLLERDIPLIEWGDHLLRVYGHPTVTAVWGFAVPDASIESASQTIREAGFLSIEPTLSLECCGVFGTAGHLFTSPGDQAMWPEILHILPQSLVHLDIEDTDISKTWLDLGLKVHQPRLPELCIALVKCLEDFPWGSRDRMEPDRHLTILIAVGAYKEKEFGKIWVPEEETESEADFQVRKSNAIKEVENWSLREGVEHYRRKVVDIVKSDLSTDNILHLNPTGE